MVRALLLILLVAASATLYSAKREQRLARSNDSGSTPAGHAGTPGPAEGSGGPAVRGTPLTSGARDDDGPSPRILPPLDADAREDLRDAMEEWGPVPAAVLILEVDRSGRREIAVAAFRALLGESVADGAATPGAATPGAAPSGAMTLELAGGEDLLLIDAHRDGGAWVGRTIDGATLRVPGSGVRSAERATAEVVESALAARRVDEARRAIADGESGTLTRLLRDALAHRDLDRAEDLFALWIGGDGPAAVAEEIADAERRRAYRALARDLAEPGIVTAGTPRDESSGIASTPAPGGPRTIAALDEFLTMKRRLRTLTPEEREAAILACDAWEHWVQDLRREPSSRPRGLTDESLARRESELRIFRFDLVKTSGF